MNVSPIIKNGTTNRKRESSRKGGGEGWELTLFLRMDIFMGHGQGQPLASVDFNLNCRKRTTNFGSVLHNLFQNNNYHFFQGILLLTINYLVYAGIVLGRYRFSSNSILYFVGCGTP